MKFCETSAEVTDYEYIAHFINSNFDSTITATALENSFGIITKLKNTYPNYRDEYNKINRVVDCLITDNVFNLIIPDNMIRDITYTIFTMAIEKLKVHCLNKHIKKIGIFVKDANLPNPSFIIYDTMIDSEEKALCLPTSIQNAIEYVFGDTDIEVHLCY